MSVYKTKHILNLHVKTIISLIHLKPGVEKCVQMVECLKRELEKVYASVCVFDFFPSALGEKGN